MGGTIPRDFIQKLLLSSDIIEIVQSRLALKQNGLRYKACCPFHDEKTPSFVVDAQRQFFYCFGCHAHGDAIGFLMKYDHLDFVDAIETLALKAGLSIPQGNQTDKKTPPGYYALLEKVQLYYQKQLNTHTVATNYLTQRGVSDAMIKRYALGYAPNAWHSLQTLAKQDQKTMQQLIETGMLVDQSHKCYDRFRHRIMFPIRNIQGHTIAFGARALEKGEPKYLNSPETEIFHKSQVLYGLYEALQLKRQWEFVLIVEGYMDVIALAQYGIDAVVGTLGTATHIQQVKKLLHYTSVVVFCFDGDSAGQKAAWSSLTTHMPLLRDGVHIRFMFLPAGEDPDSAVRKRGKEAFLFRAKQSLELSDFLFQKLDAMYPHQSLAGKASYAQAGLKLIETMPQGVFKQLFYGKLSAKLQIPMKDLMAVLSQKVTTPPTLATSKSQLSIGQQAIALLLQYPELAFDIPWLCKEKDHAFDELILLNHVAEFVAKNPQFQLSQLIESLRLEHPNADASIAALFAWQPSAPMSQPTAHKVFADMMQRIGVDIIDQKLEALIEKSRMRNLSTEEYQQYQQWLDRKKQWEKPT